MENRKPKKVSLYNAINIYKLKDRTITGMQVEMGEPSRQQAKVMLFIPVTGSIQTLKYRNNKIAKTY